MDKIVFLHRVQAGGADRSYGIEAGRLAGLPLSVIMRAKQVMGQIEKHSKIAVGLRKDGGRKSEGGEKREKGKTEEGNGEEQLGIF